MTRHGSLLAEHGTPTDAADRSAGARILLRSVPAVPAERLLALGSGDALLWAPPGDTEWAGLGACLTFTAAGEDRFASLRRQTEPFWRRLRLEGDTEAPLARLFGGFAFRPGGAEAEHWQGFGDARFLLPRFSYARSGERAWLGLALRDDDAAHADALRGQWEEIARALGQRAAAEEAVAATRVLDRDEPSEAEWTRLIDGIRAGIATGRVEKVVAARRLAITLSPPPDPVTLLARLRRVSPATTRFAFRIGEATFLGATPERLLARRGLALETEALAGSIRPGSASAAARLLASSKDHHEHELVVRDLLRVLTPLCRSLEYSGHPRVQALRHVLHLRTPVHGELREALHVLELVERLHPTPAVGGVPRAAALDWIAEHEPRPRGWYAGPVGWFDAAGDGEFAVALRSGILRGATAHLYAGGGIVADSDAAGELAETHLKLAALLDALTGSEVGPAPHAGGPHAPRNRGGGGPHARRSRASGVE